MAALTATGNAALGDAEATDTHAIKGATTLLANSASAALTITQTGAGNAFVVEDSASTDSTPFVIDASGNVGIGLAPSTYKLYVTGGQQYFANSKSLSETITVWENFAGVATALRTDGSAYPVFGTSTNHPFQLQTNNTEKFRIGTGGTTTLGGTSTAPALSVVPVASQVNWVKISPAATGVGATITTDGEATVPLLHNTKGGAYQSFLTNSFEQVRVTHTSSATRYITLTGGNATSPTISVGGGSAGLKLYGSGGTGIEIDASGAVGIGNTPSAITTLGLAKLMTGGTTAYGMLNQGEIQADVTVQGILNRSYISTKAAAFTCANVYGFQSVQGSIGAGSAITNQYGFSAAATLIGATNNYGFYSDIAAASNRYNFFANGSAQNYFAGVTGVGIAASSTSAFTVAASTTSVASLRIPHGSAPSSPTNGDMWTTTAGLYVRINGATVGPLT
jgi:hypothetical protein